MGSPYGKSYCTEQFNTRDGNGAVVQFPGMFETMSRRGDVSNEHPLRVLPCHRPRHVHGTFERIKAVPIVGGNIQTAGGTQQPSVFSDPPA